MNIPSASSSTVTVITGSLNHDYVARMAEIVRDIDPNVVFVPRGSVKSLMMNPPKPAVLHLHWTSGIFRRPKYRHSLLGVAHLLTYVILVRARGIGIVWTLHNPIGKGHARPALDRFLTNALALVCNQFVVLNPGVAELVAAGLHPLSRGRFLRRVHLVPMPLSLTNHGQRMDRESARSELGLQSSVPVVAYLPGSNQRDVSPTFHDEAARYGLLTIRRDSEATGLAAVAGGWTFLGRPTDEEYGMLVCASDAIVLGEVDAYGSMTVLAAVDLRRPVISASCPAIHELAELGGAIATESRPSPDDIVGAMAHLQDSDLVEAFIEYERRHGDALIADAMRSVYRRAGLPV